MLGWGFFEWGGNSKIYGNSFAVEFSQFFVIIFTCLEFVVVQCFLRNLPIKIIIILYFRPSKAAFECYLLVKKKFLILVELYLDCNILTYLVENDDKFNLGL